LFAGKFGITNKDENDRCPCWRKSAGAKLGIIILAIILSSTIMILAGKST
jgi:hypothetical protein